MRYKLSVLPFVLLLAFAAAAQGQTQAKPVWKAARVSKPPVAQAPGAVQGRVLAVDSGLPLAKVDVGLYPVKSSASIHYATATNDAGEYSFARVPPGTYAMSISRSGYLGKIYGQDACHPAGQFLAVSSGNALRDLNVHLNRTGAVEGQVVDSKGQPLSSVAVHLGQFRTEAGVRMLMPGPGATTDDRGNFRLFNVNPGTYYIVASRRAVSASSKTTHARAYYPNAASPADAQTIQLEAGAEMSGIQIVMRETAALTLSGRVTMEDGGAGRGFTVSARPAPFGESVAPADLATARTDNQGNFTLPGLYPDTYRLLVRGVLHSVARGASGTVDLTKNSASGVKLVVGSGAEIAGKVIFEGPYKPAAAALRQVRIAVRADMELGSAGVSKGSVQEDGSFRVANIVEGSARVVVTPPGSFYVKAIRIGGVDVTDRVVEFKDKAKWSDAEVVVSSDGGHLHGEVTSGSCGAIATGVTVVLFASDAALRSGSGRFTKVTVTDDQGRYSFGGIVPGDYLACALEGTEPGIANDEPVLASVAGLARRLSFMPNQVRAETLSPARAPAR